MNRTKAVGSTWRHALSAVGGFLIATGVTDADTFQQMTGGVIALIAFADSLKEKFAR